MVSLLTNICVTRPQWVNGDIRSVVSEAGVSRAGKSNCITQILWDVISCPCLWKWYWYKVILFTYLPSIPSINLAWMPNTLKLSITFCLRLLRRFKFKTYIWKLNEYILLIKCWSSMSYVKTDMPWILSKHRRWLLLIVSIRSATRES